MYTYKVCYQIISHLFIQNSLTLVLLIPHLPCLCIQYRSRSVVSEEAICHSLCEFILTICIKESDWLTIRNGCGILIYSAWQGSRGLDTFSIFSAIFYTGDNFCNFLFEFHNTKYLWKGVYSKRKEFASKGSKFFPFREDPFQKGDKTIFTSPEGVSFPFKNLKWQTQQLSSALSSAVSFKSHCCKQCGPRSDCCSRSSLIWVHSVCLYAKSMFEKFARRCSRRHKQTTFSDVVFLGILRVN